MTILQVYILGAALYFAFAVWRVVKTDREVQSPFPQGAVIVMLAFVTICWPVVIPFTIARQFRDAAK